jgi:hypothetical protein
MGVQRAAQSFARSAYGGDGNHGGEGEDAAAHSQRMISSMTRRKLLPLLLLYACADTSGLTGGTRDAALPDGEVPGDAGTPGDASITDPTLLVYWSFDERDPAVAHDNSGHGTDASLVGATFTTGVRGSALQLDGSGHVEAPTLDAAAFPRSGTFSIWFKWDHPANETSVDRAILDEYDTTRSHVFFRHPIGSMNGDDLQIAGQASSSDYVFAYDFAVPRDSWHVATFTWDELEKRSRVYLDASLAQDAPYLGNTAFAPNGERCRIGARFIGALDEIRLYSRVLSESEIAALK